MTEKEFVKFANRVVLSTTHMDELIEAFDGVNLYEQNFASFLNFADRIAWWGLGFSDELETEEGFNLYDAFCSDFWEMVENGEVSFSYTNNMSENIRVVIKTWSDFYKYWKENGENDN